ncbi:MAG: hypothetical protein K1X79_01675 [Oligoflexia bacterium]|nr:hypothetical protein [Oligoflexia bacterium]
MDYQEWYQQNYHELTGHGLWLRGAELNRLAPEAYSERALRVLFVRLSTYFDTGYSFTHQFLYQIAAGLDGVFPDLGFLPPAKDAELFKRARVPWLLGTQTKRGPKDFEVVGFSNSIVQELINIPAFLKNSGVSLSKHERLSDSSTPLLIMGGANALYSSVLWSTDPIVDGIFVGESDVGIKKILSTIRDAKAAGSSKQDTLAALETIDGFFQPDRPRPTRKYFVPNLGESEALEKAPVYYLADQVGSSHLQISEGCPCFCSFCAESWDRKPYRERRADRLRDVANKLKAAMGLDEIDIYSFNFNMHSDFYQVLWDLVPRFRRIGLKSQRFDLLAHDPQMIEFQHVIEKASITCGLEGISPRLRRYLHKNLEDSQLHDSLTAIFNSKARELKVFLIATGLEEEQDFIALGDLLEHIKSIHERCHAGTRIILSMTPLVRFPWTPLEFEDAFPMSHYQRILNRVREVTEQASLQFRESADLPEYWVSQVLVRAADTRVGKALLSALASTDFVYYRAVSAEFQKALEASLVREGLDPSALLNGHSLEESETKPWAILQTGVRREFLWAEVQRARSYKEIDYCLGRSWVKSQCFRCGGCPSKFHIRDIVLARQTRSYSLDQFKAHVTKAREQRQPVSFLVQAGAAARGVPRKMLAVALARALMLADGDLVAGYQGFQSSRFDCGEEENWIIGSDVLTLLWRRDNLEMLVDRLSNPAFISSVNGLLANWGTLLGIAPDKWEPTSICISSTAEPRCDAFLKARGLKATFRRIGETGSVYEFSKDSIKKGICSSIKISRGTTFYTDVTPGKKFSPQEFLRECFSAPGKHEWVRAVCVVNGAERAANSTQPEMHQCA